MLLKRDIFNIKSLLTIILITTNKSTQFFADSYLLKHHSAVSRWCNGKAVPNTEDLSKIVEFTISETTNTQRKLIKDQITSLVNESAIDKDIQASVLAIDDFSSFLLECLKICACKLSYSLNAHKLNRYKNDSADNEIACDECVTDKIYIPSPIKPTKSFVAREYELEKLKNMINEKNAALLINGFGGIGKTELCRKYFWDYKDMYAFAGWINYTNNLKESVISQISVEGLKFSESTDMDNKYSKIIMYLNKLPANSLLVIDNLKTNKEDDINTILSLPIKILAISRESFEAFTSFTVDVLKERSCIDLFYKYFAGKRDDENLKKIITLTGNHTLTIELLAKTASNAAIEVKELYEKLTACGFDLSKEIKKPFNISMKNSKENISFPNTFYWYLISQI